MPASSPSLARRAVLALALLAGFYILAIAIALGLLLVPYAEAALIHRVTARLAAFCVIGAGIILWSIAPRPERFVPPGPRLRPGQQPRLFAELVGVARAVGQEMPEEVYLVPGVEAWVGQRGGIVGLGSHQVMGLGLPLLQALSVAQLRAILAHEFGHYHAGDTRLGPLVYRTRAAIGRTLQGLARHSSVLQLPFVWYGNLFLRVSHAVSRRQEALADELAARTVGSGPFVEGLRIVYGAALAFPPYWQNEVVPILRAGYQPPLAEGFARFLRAAPMAAAVSRAVVEEENDSGVDPYDTHPPLCERIAAVQGLPVGEAGDGTPAISLLVDVPGLEAQLLVRLAGKERAGALKPLTWGEAGTSVYLPIWRDLVRKYSGVLAEVTPDGLPGLARDLPAFTGRLATASGGKLDPEQSTRLAPGVVGAALILGLVRQGWQLEAEPGAEVVLRHGEANLEPFRVLTRLASGELAADHWREQCAAWGIGALDLST